jgi:hypothetical protein
MFGAPPAAKANFLLNRTFEAVTSTGGSSPQFSPDHWTVSAVNGSGGVLAIACPAFFGSGCNGKGGRVTVLNDSLPAGNLPRPVALRRPLRNVLLNGRWADSLRLVTATAEA